MCELSTKLIAWLDGELPDGEAVEVEQHIHTCGECRECLARYRKVSGMLGVYCDATLAAKEPKRTMPGWAPVLGAAAGLALLLAVLVRPHIERSLAPASAPTTPAASTIEASILPKAAPEVAAPAIPPHRVHSVMSGKQHKPAVLASSHSQGQSRVSNWLSAGPAIEIAIPGDDVLPPGALPPGIAFVANVSIASDGSAQRLQLHPQLTGFEGGHK